MTFNQKIQMLSACLVMVVFTSCQNDSFESGEVLVSVNNEAFTQTDLLGRMPKGYQDDDSARLADKIINDWIEEKVVLQFAEQNLNTAQKDFSTQLENYRENLVIYTFERELVRQKLDTLISDLELLTYYGENVDNFKLRNHTVKTRFIKLSVDAPKAKQVDKWFKGDSEEDLELLEEYCLTYAENFFLQEDMWLYLHEVQQEVPFPVSNWDEFLSKTTYFEFEYGSFRYLVRFFDYKLKGEASPLELEQERIAELILNKRKLDLINQMRLDILKEARANNNIQFKESD